ncbi:uncharacterized protein LOC119590112 isoform X2 [Penaeus monodon]|uniref:uncharacterized protein LOC119590112 isoform X2 n=1 Tax=Penaeus monodon TaxID=6687 RepID=UPI0018A7D208|nr:uncharacterized protein LOC119590112 isoform X2 [Penaeus monodon]
MESPVKNTSGESPEPLEVDDWGDNDDGDEDIVEGDDNDDGDEGNDPLHVDDDSTDMPRETSNYSQAQSLYLSEKQGKKNIMLKDGQVVQRKKAQRKDKGSRRISREGSMMQVELLISLVQERRAIYDPSDPVHGNRYVIAALWNDIATEMKCKESDCKEKWQQLRSNFMREKRRFTTHTSGSASIKAKKWVFYNAMEFLIPYVTPRTRSCNVPPPPNEDIKSEFDMDDAASDDTSSTTNITDAPDSVRSVQTANNIDICEGGITRTSTPVIKQPSSYTRKHNASKRCRCELPSDVDGQIMGELQKLREQAVCKNENESDPDRQFLLSLLPLFKQLSPIDSIDIKIEIHQAFRRKLAKDQNSSYGYWTGQHQYLSHNTLSPCASDSASSEFTYL